MQTDEEQIYSLIEHWMSAMMRGDVERVLALISDDALFLLPGRSPMSKADFAESQRAAGHIRFQISFDIQEIFVSGDLAYSWNHIRVSIPTQDGAEPHRRAGNVLSVFRREAGHWRLLRDANQLTDQEP